LHNLLVFVRGFGLKEYPEMLNILVETCVDITRTGGTAAAVSSSRAASSSRESATGARACITWFGATRPQYFGRLTA